MDSAKNQEKNETVAIEAPPKEQQESGKLNGNEEEKEEDEEREVTSDDIMIDIDDVSDDFIFSDDAFLTLPDFPCMSSPTPSSTSINNHLPNNPSLSSASSSSSSSTSPWSFLAVPGPPQDPGAVVPASEAVEWWDPSIPLDPSLLFPDDGSYDPSSVQATPLQDGGGGGGHNGSNVSEDLKKIFLDWLKNNKDSIFPEDLRNIKLKTSTIECAAARLGGGKQGRMQLLKLILAWVQNHHLQKKRRRTTRYDNQEPQYFPSYPQLPLPPPPPAYPHYQFEHANLNPNPNLEYNCDQWNNMQLPIESPVYHNAPPPPMAPYHYYQSAGTSSVLVNSQPFAATTDFNTFSPPPLHYSPFACTSMPCVNPIPQYSMYPTSSLAGASSATKEARKKRMARQRRSSTLHQHRIQNHSQNMSEKASASGSSSNNGSSKNLGLWENARQKNLPCEADPSLVTLPVNSTNMQQSRNVVASEKRQGWKSEKNLRFLLQKVLKQSDVGSLGRIVLPKKEAEIHLPELDTRDGISIPMEDIGTSRVWNMRFRYWPNNKSRMYLLENTGDFVRSNGLQEGDFIVIYSDVKCNKYLIRGVKVRPPVEPKGVAGSRRQSAAKAHQQEEQ